MPRNTTTDLTGSDAKLNKRFHLIGVCLLVVGLVAATLVYVTASSNDGSGASGYDVVNGTAYPTRPDDSKSYEYDLERIGGKSAVLGVEINQWFAGLWHGKRLAYTLGVLSLGSSLVCFFFAYFVTFPPPEDNGGDDNEV